jgi:DNA-binding NtrC family response regulator
VAPLAEHLIGEFGRELGRPRLGFTRAALEKLAGHAWPGNVRELRNAVERAMLMAEGDWIGPDDLVLAPAARRGGAGGELGPEGFSLADTERAVVLAALRRSGFVQKAAAELLGVSRRKLNYMIGRMGITHPSWRRHRTAGDGTGGEPAGASLDSASDLP